MANKNLVIVVWTCQAYISTLESMMLFLSLDQEQQTLGDLGIHICLSAWEVETTLA